MECWIEPLRANFPPSPLCARNLDTLIVLAASLFAREIGGPCKIYRDQLHCQATQGRAYPLASSSAAILAIKAAA